MSAGCPTATDTTHRHLQGTWQATIEGQGTALMRLGPHPELSESVRGQVEHTAGAHHSQALVSGDVDLGELALEESHNGTNISATWIGQVVDGTCGKEIRGTWNKAHPPSSHPFVLRKQIGWQ